MQRGIPGAPCGIRQHCCSASGLPLLFIGPLPSMLLCPGIGEFQCYDRFMLDSLRAAAEAAGHPEWYAAQYFVPFSYSHQMACLLSCTMMALLSLQRIAHSRRSLKKESVPQHSCFNSCRASPPRDGAGSYDFVPW